MHRHLDTLQIGLRPHASPPRGQPFTITESPDRTCSFVDLQSLAHALDLHDELYPLFASCPYGMQQAYNAQPSMSSNV